MWQFVLAFVAVLAGISDGQTINNKEVGSFQQFECGVTFPSVYLLNWMRGDEIVIRYVNGAISATSTNFTGRVSIVGPQNSLGITSLRIADAGEFFCSVVDLGAVNPNRNSARQTLLVYTRPTVTLPYSEYVVDAGGDVTFTCTVTSYPSSNVTWEHPDGTRSTGDVLRLRNATSQSQGQYRCSADNGFGTDMQYVDLVVREPTRPTPGGSEGQTDPTRTSDRPIKTRGPQTAEGTSGGLTGGVIAAIVVVCAVLVLAGIMAAVIFVTKSRKKHQPEKPVVTASPVKEKAADDWDLTSTRRPQNGMNGNGHTARPAAEGKPADPYFYTEAPPRDTGSYYSQASRQPRPGDPYWTPSPPPSQAGWSSPPQSPSHNQADLDYVHMTLQHAPAGSRRPIVGMVYDA